MKFKPVIKWSGSKRGQSEQIVSFFPKNINIYYEPFCGSCSVMFQLLNSKDIKVNKYVCSDINNDLIELWLLIKDKPLQLFEEYEIRWNKLNDLSNIELKNEFYYYIRNRFNNEKNIYDFYFLTRTCFNGLIRYNKKLEFNSPFHINRNGIKPGNIKLTILEWSEKIQKVEFKCCTYNEIQGENNDFIYCDPPYKNTKAMYYGIIDYDNYFNWLKHQKCNYIFSFDGVCDSNNYLYNIPKYIYDEHYYMEKEISSYRRLNKEKNYVQESLYIKNK